MSCVVSFLGYRIEYGRRVLQVGGRGGGMGRSIRSGWSL